MEQKKFFSNIGMAFFIFIIVTLAAQCVIEIVILLAAPWIFNITVMEWIISFGTMYVIAAPFCVRFLKRADPVHLYESSLKVGRWLILLCICEFVMYAGSIIGDVVNSLIIRFTRLDPTMNAQLLVSESNLWLVLIFTVILAPIVEEFIFRKILIDRTVVFGDRAAILLSASLFGLFHGNFYQLFYAFGLGCIFSYVYIRTGKIRYTISLHMAVNFLGGFVSTAISRRLNSGALINSVTGENYLNYIYSHIGALAAMMLFNLLIIAMFIIGLVMFILNIRKTELRPGEFKLSSGWAATVILNPGMILYIAVCALMFIFSLVGT